MDRMDPPPTPRVVTTDETTPKLPLPQYIGNLNGTPTIKIPPRTLQRDLTVVIFSPLYDTQLQEFLPAAAAIGVALLNPTHYISPLNTQPGITITTASQIHWDRDSCWLSRENHADTWHPAYPQHNSYGPMLDLTPAKTEQLFTERSIARFLTGKQWELCRRLCFVKGAACQQRLRRIQVSEAKTFACTNEIVLQRNKRLAGQEEREAIFAEKITRREACSKTSGVTEQDEEVCFESFVRPEMMESDPASESC